MVTRTHAGTHTHHVDNGSGLAHIQRHAAELHGAHTRRGDSRAQADGAHGAVDKGEAVGRRVDHVGIDDLDGTNVLHLQAVANQIANLDGTHGSSLDDAQQRFIRLDGDLDDGVIAVGGIELLADAVVDGVVASRCARRHSHLASHPIEHRYARVTANGLGRCGHRAGDAVGRERRAVQRVVLGVGITHFLITARATVARVAVVLGVDR